MTSYSGVTIVLCVSLVVGAVLHTWIVFPLSLSSDQTHFSAAKPDSMSSFCSQSSELPCQDFDFGHSKIEKNDSPFSRVMIMLVDAFRPDFMLRDDVPSNMPFLSRLLSASNALAFISKAEVPTVTLPRLKALLAGVVPNFMDVALNFDSPAFHTDSLVSQWRAQKSRMVFYGDDTWTRLFPNTFTRSEGVSSFFVSDTSQVDHNVTRNLRREMEQLDAWDVCVLHYLGLDHAGHLHGPASQRVAEKAHEMDTIAREIFAKLHDSGELETTLFLFVSDHGMNEHGNHGGCSSGETASLLYFAGGPFTKNTEDLVMSLTAPVSPSVQSLPSHDMDAWLSHMRRTSEVVKQVDLSPTVASLLKIAIPQESTGRVILPVVQRAQPKCTSWLTALKRNAKQLMSAIRRSPGEWDDMQNVPLTPSTAELWASYQKSVSLLTLVGCDESHTAFTSAVHHVVAFIQEASHRLDRRATERSHYAVGVTLLSLWLTAMATIGLCLVPSLSLRLWWHVWGWLFTALWALILASHVSMCQILPLTATGVFCRTSPSSLGAVMVLTGAMAFALTVIFQSLRGLYPSPVKCLARAWVHVGLPETGLIAGTFGHLLALFGSSLIEEEHLFWYFVASWILALYGMRALSLFLYPSSDKYDVSKSVLLILGLLGSSRLLRAWNQTGNKWMSLPDIHSWISASACQDCWTDPMTLLAVCAVGMMSMFAIVFYRRTKVLSALFKGAIVGLVVIGSCLAGRFTIITEAIQSLTGTVDTVLYERLSFLVMGVLVVMAVVAPLFRVSSGTQPIKRTLWNSHARFIIVYVAVCLAMMLVHRRHNLLLFPIFGVQVLLLIELMSTRMRGPSPTWYLVLMGWMGRCAFSMLGNSSSLATIHVSGAYTGLSAHHKVIVGILGFIITYSGPIIFAMSMPFVLVAWQTSQTQSTHSPSPSPPSHSERTNPKKETSPPSHPQTATSSRPSQESTFDALLPTLVMIRATEFAVFCVVMWVFQNHLFIWSVFSPKYLYELGDLLCDALMLIILSVLGRRGTALAKTHSR